MEFVLKVYDEEDNEVKVYTKQGYAIKMVMLKNIIESLELDKLGTLMATEKPDMAMVEVAGGMVVNAYDVIRDLMKKMFRGMTDEEYENTHIDEVAAVIVGLVKYTAQTIKIAGGKGKN